MILESAHLLRYRTHRDTRVTFATDGTTAIMGPNEVGKSAILEAIGWCLYGAAAVASTMDRVRWRGAPANTPAAVTVVMSHKGTRYRAWRSESDAALVRLDPDGTEVQLAGGRTDTAAQVGKVLGMTWREWSSAWLAPQRELDRLGTMSGPDRQSFYLRLMGVDAVDDAVATCRDRKNALRKAADAAAAAVGPAQPYEVQYAAAATRARQAADALDGAKASVTTRAATARVRAQDAEAAAQGAGAWRDADDAVQDAAQAVAAADSVASYADDEVADALAARDRLASAPDHDVDAARDRLDAAKAQHTAVVAARDAVAAARTAADTYTKANAAWQEAQATVDAYDPDAHQVAADHAEAFHRNLAAARDQHAKGLATRRAAVDAARAHRDRLQDRVDALQALDRDAACPTCVRPLADAYDDAVATLRAEAAAGEDDLQAARDALGRYVDDAPDLDAMAAEVAAADKEAAGYDRAATRADDARARLDDLRAAADAALDKSEAAAATARDACHAVGWSATWPARDYIWDAVQQAKAAVDKATADLGHVTDRAAEFRTDRRMAGNLDDLRHAAQVAHDELGAARVAHAQAVADLDAVDYDPDKATAAATALRDVQADLDAARTALDTARQAHDQAGDDLADAWDALCDYRHRAAAVAAKRAAHQTHVAADELLTGFRAHVVDGIRPALEDIASGMVAALTDGRHEAVRVTDDYDIVLLEDGAEEHDYSGGAGDIRSLVMRVSVSELIARRAGHAGSGLWLDEPFRYMDGTRRANVVTMLRNLRDVFPQSVLITHQADTAAAVDHAVHLAWDDVNRHAVLVGGDGV